MFATFFLLQISLSETLFTLPFHTKISLFSSVALVRIQNVGCHSPGIEAIKPGDPRPGLQPWGHDPAGHQHIHCGLRCKVGHDPLGSVLRNQNFSFGSGSE